MTDPKPSTNDILAKIRAKAADSAPAEKPASSDAPAPEASPAAESAAAASEIPAKPAEAPKSTSDILAAARAKAKPANPADILAAARKPAAAAGSETPAAAAPKSPADIMAAIRAKAGTAPAAGSAAVAKPAAKTEATPADTKAAAGLSAAEMIKAARSAADGTPIPPKVVLPSKPLGAKATPAKSAPAVDRRNAVGTVMAVLLSPVVIAWVSFVASLTASGLAVARFMMPNVLVEPPTKFKIGPPNDYAPGTVSTKWQAQYNVWVVNAEVDGTQMIYALSTVCTHLGCTPNWLEGEQKFKCPCHGSGFYKNGVNFEGPAPRPLERVGIRLAEDGMLEVDKSVKFQKELGQWSNSSSFVGVT
jgi:cytochrome b6-f complex iron-sulfur subunit